jgi:hypothetical protein
MWNHGHGTYDMHPTEAALHLRHDHGAEEIGADPAAQHERLHKPSGVDEGTEESRALLQAKLYLDDAGPEGPARLREAVGRLAQPLPEIFPVAQDVTWRRQNRYDQSLSHALHFANSNPSLLVSETGLAGAALVADAAMRVVTMARVFCAYMAEVDETLTEG